MLFYGMALPDNPYDVVHIELEVREHSVFYSVLHGAVVCGLSSKLVVAVHLAPKQEDVHRKWLFLVF